MMRIHTDPDPELLRFTWRVRVQRDRGEGDELPGRPGERREGDQGGLEHSGPGTPA
jgi:hypothetical protein